jgi:predicted nucleic acid-binding protein
LEIARPLARHRLVAVDTCVFIYLMERNPRYFDVSNAVFGSIESGKASAVTSTVVLTEILVQPCRNENLAQAEAFYGPLTMLPNLEWVPPSR